MAPRNGPGKSEDIGTETFGDDGGGWERLEVGIGEKIEWGVTPLFEGTYRGSSEVIQQATGEVCPVFLFTGLDGEECFAWQTYQLSKAMERCDIGDTVRIQFIKQSIKADGQSVNNFKVYRKAASTAAVGE